MTTTGTTTTSESFEINGMTLTYGPVLIRTMRVEDRVVEMGCILDFYANVRFHDIIEEHGLAWNYAKAAARQTCRSGGRVAQQRMIDLGHAFFEAIEDLCPEGVWFGTNPDSPDEMGFYRNEADM